MKKKIVACLILVALIVAMCCVFSGCAKEGEGELVFKEIEGGLEVRMAKSDAFITLTTGETVDTDIKEIEIPSKVGGVAVTQIAKNGFINCKKLKKIIIPSTVKTISEGAFSALPSLKEVVFAEGLETIGIYAFSGSGLTELNLPATVKIIDKEAFYGCQIKDLNLPTSVREIRAGAFGSNDAITQLVLPSGLKSIGGGGLEGGAFGKTINLKNIYIPSSVNTIMDSAFTSYNDESASKFPQKNIYVESSGIGANWDEDWAFWYSTSSYFGEKKMYHNVVYSSTGIPKAIN